LQAGTRLRIDMFLKEFKLLTIAGNGMGDYTFKILPLDVARV